MGRFIQPDTIVPEPGNPQALNRYAYVKNNPLRYVDSNGHCGPLTPVCLALLLGGMALLLQGDSPDLNVTPEDVASQRLGGALFVGGATLATGGALAGTVGAARVGTTAATAACADGDCTNEIGAATNTAQRVWQLNPLERGRLLHQTFGQNLPDKFPTVDIMTWDKGIVTSIKSLDLSAKTYQNIPTLTRTVQGYITKLANFQGATHLDVEIRQAQILGRELFLIIPRDASEAQLAALRALQEWAAKMDIVLKITPFE